MYTPEKLAFLRLARSKNVGSVTLFNLIESCGSSLAAIDYIYNLPQNKIILSSTEEIEKEIYKIEKFGAKIITFFDENYPSILKEIPDQPLILTTKGNLNLFNQNAIAIVGSRNASLNGINFTKQIAQDLIQNDIITISGLARGIDAAAHESSYQKGTIAVIAGSIDNIYPKENLRLYEKIFEHGLIITEMPFSSPPKPENFIQRNRIISGLSLGTIVIEAGLKSGSLTTARFALEQGREVFAMPGFPLDPRSQGSNKLLKEGAKLIENIDDILEEFPFLNKNKITQEPCITKEEPLISKDSDIAKISKEILQKLSFSTITIEELIENLQMPSKLINIALTQLELMDKIEVNLGKINLKT